MGNRIIIPPEWMPTDDWNSHRPLLYIALYHSYGTIIELGCGNGSTPLIEGFCRNQERGDFLSFETNVEYERFFDCTMLVSDYGEAEASMPCSVLFIDCAPGEIRKELIGRYANDACIIVVHDSEPGAEYVYHMAEVLSTFKYRCDCIIEGAPQTTAVSNIYDFKRWIGEYDGFKIV